MSTSSRQLLSALVTCVVGMTGITLALGWYASGHYLPLRNFRNALAVGDGCVAYAGDSRMVAGVKSSLLKEELARRGLRTPCVANLSMAGSTPLEQWLAVRNYLAAGRKPSMLILGVSSESPLPQPPPDPNALIGNRAVTLAWSDWSDVTNIYYERSVVNFDRAFRFAILQATPLGQYVSLVWGNIQSLQDKLMSDEATIAVNEFGVVGDMRQLAAERLRDGTLRLRTWSPTDPWDKSFDALRELSVEHGIPLVIVEVPMPQPFVQHVSKSAKAQLVRSRLQGLVRGRGCVIDLSRMPGITDAHFPDHLHLDSGGAARFTAQLAERISLPPCTGSLKNSRAPQRL